MKPPQHQHANPNPESERRMTASGAQVTF